MRSPTLLVLSLSDNCVAVLTPEDVQREFALVMQELGASAAPPDTPEIMQFLRQHYSLVEADELAQSR